MNAIENGQQLAKVEDELSKVSFPTVDLSTFKMEDLDEAEVMPIELSSIYWTPEKDESFRVVFIGIENVAMLPIGNEGKSQLNDDGMVVLPCAYFIVRSGDAVVKICNASKRLISTLRMVKPMTPLLITYAGKVKNKNNAFSSDSWSVKPINTQTIFIAEKVKDDIANNGNNEEIGFADEEPKQQHQESQQTQQGVNAGNVTSGGTQKRRF